MPTMRISGALCDVRNKTFESNDETIKKSERGRKEEGGKTMKLLITRTKKEGRNKRRKR